MFETGYTLRWTEEIFKTDEVQINPVTYELEDKNVREIRLLILRSRTAKDRSRGVEIWEKCSKR